MVVELGALSIGIFLVVFALLILGFVIYLLKNYCQMRMRQQRRAASAAEQRRNDPLYGLTTDDESTIKLHTMEQILKQEERTAIAQGKSLNLVALKFQKPDANSKELSKEVT